MRVIEDDSLFKFSLIIGLTLFLLGIGVGVMIVDTIYMSAIKTDIPEIKTELIKTSETKETLENTIDLINELMEENYQLKLENDELKKLSRLDDFTDEEWVMLYRVVRSEAGSWSAEGQKNVAKVIFNRIESDRFPNSVEDVIMAPGQFEVVSNGSFYAVEISAFTIENCKAAYLEWLEGGNAMDALFFHSGPGYAQTREFLFEDEVGHKFYK